MMGSAELPPTISDVDERARLDALERLQILDTMPEQAYDDLVLLASTICGTPIALVSLIDRDRQWFKAHQGIGLTETDRSIAFCGHAIRRPDEVMVVPDASRDPRFAANPLVAGEPHVRFYAGAPLVTRGGVALGTICVLDDKPHTLTPQQTDALSAIARQVMHLLELRQTNDELKRLAEENARMNAQLLRYQRELEEQNAELTIEAKHDALTGLLNRSGLNKLRELAQASGWHRSRAFSIAVIDLDHFKRINDTYGHAVGDQVLQVVAEEIRRATRGGDYAARFGGEEFVVIMPDTPTAGARTVMERLRKGLAGRAGELPAAVTLSIGLASSRPGLDDPDAIFRQADQALYLAKNKGRDRVEVLED